MAVSDTPSGAEGAHSAGSMLHTFVRRGRSFSGRERNCCFLNTGNSDRRRFANISSVSGFDFPDDGRAVARTDWDHDGDLDFWVVNRNGPQVRFLRNDVPGGNHHLSIRLVGTDCNRDAIGARVELVLEGSSEHKLVKTVRAGDGFLAQSSKWVHFGLGEATSIERLEVRWPGGDVERIRGVEVDGRYRIEQGRGEAETWPQAKRSVQLEPAELTPPASDEQLRAVSTGRLPVPAIGYETFDGRRLPIVGPTGATSGKAPTLVVLWASWCRPCLLELREMASRSEEIHGSSLEVVLLSVDLLDKSSSVTRARLQGIVDKLELPFASGLASEQAIEKLQTVHDRLFDLHRPFPVPTSFLIDARGELVVLYRGRVSVDQLVRDVAKLAKKTDDRRREPTPFGGRWLRPPARISPFRVAWDLLEKGYTEEGIQYVASHRDLLTHHARFPGLAVLVGNARLGRGEAKAAVALYREALALDSGYADAQNNLAWILATHPDDRLRDGGEAVRLAEAAMRATRGASSSMWSTLAAAYAEAGQYDQAVAAAERALDMARRGGNEQLAGSMAERLEIFRDRRPFRTE